MDVTKEIKNNILYFIEESKIVEAKELLEQYVEIVGQNSDVFYLKGVIHLKKEMFEDSLHFFNRALEGANDEEKKHILEKIDAINRQIATRKNKIQFYFNGTIDNNVLRLFYQKDIKSIVDIINNKIGKFEYIDVIAISNYWLTNYKMDLAYANYFLAVAANGIKDFENAVKYHKIALELDPYIADLKNRKSIYQKKYEENHTNCIGCGNEKSKIINVSNQSISEDNKNLINPIRIWVECESCGLIYANPLPDEKVLNDYYSIIAKEKFGGIYGDIDKRFEFLVSLANERLKRIEYYTKEKKKLLDIGSGIGTFIGVAMERGWDAIGIELTPEDCKYAKENFGIELLQENFYNLTSNEKKYKYDVVTIFEVIEHLQSPLKDLKEINKLLELGGLLVLATPIHDSMFGKKSREKNIFWNVVSHLTYFNRNVLTKYLNEAGFDVFEISPSNEGMGRFDYYCKKTKEVEEKPVQFSNK